MAAACLWILTGSSRRAVARAVPACGVRRPRRHEPPADVANEYRITAFPSYRINDNWSGFGYLGWVSKPDADYTSYYLGKGLNYAPVKWIQIWGGLIAVYTDSAVKSNSLELRPFVGVEVHGLDRTRGSGATTTGRATSSGSPRPSTRTNGQTVHRVRNQSRLEIPLASVDRAWTPRSWYLLSDVEPIYRSDTGQIDPLRMRVGLGYITNRRVLVEFHYFAQYTRPEGGASRTPTTSSA